MKKWFESKILASNKKTLFFIGGIVFFVLFVYQIILFSYGTYFNSNSDDVLQYSPIMTQYIEYLKDGKLGWFNYKNGLGSSIFADIYYIPLDIFSLLTLLFSFVIDEVIAFSIAELLKILFGVIVFSFFLQKCHYKNWIVITLSVAYFCAGGCWVFSVFPTYLSMFFYLPLSMLVVHYYTEGKRWLLPLYGAALILYNFYNAYALFIFMLIVYIIKQIKDNYSGFKVLVKESFVFGLHIVLSVFMGLFILLPSVLYILNNTFRDNSDFQIFFDLEIYFRMICKLFVYEPGAVGLVAGAGNFMHYMQNHYSYCIGISGLFCLSLLFHMKDRVSKIYKWVIIILVLSMIMPITSMILSVSSIGYLRWLSYVNIVFLYFIGHVLETAEFKDFSYRQKLTSFLILTFLFIVAIIYSIVNVDKKGSYYLVMLLFCLIFFVLYIVFYFSKQKDLLRFLMLSELIVILFMNLSVSFKAEGMLEVGKYYNEINDIVDNLLVEDNSVTRVYVDTFNKYNNSRILNEFTNESTFHSFLPKSVYDYQFLYRNASDMHLTGEMLKNYSPSYSRSIDYKYIITYKKEKDYLDYLPIYYEDENYVVYENIYYEPFYVYESYYEYDDVKNLNYENDYIEFQKKLFNGVILEEKDYNLVKLDYSYEDSNTKKINAKNELVLENIGLNKYSSNFNWLDVKYKGRIYIYGKDYKEIKGIKTVNGELSNECDFSEGVYQCYFSNSIDSIVVESSTDSLKLYYYIVLEDDNGDLLLTYKIDEKLSDKYINYYMHFSNDQIFLIDDNNEMKCLHGICNVGAFDAKYVLYEGVFLEDLKKGKDLYFSYQEEDLSFYNDNKMDIYANNKILEFEGSKLKIKYDRISSSKNDQVVVLPITYSKEWQCENENYELVKANGGYLGILVKKEVKNIDVCITFRPSGVKIGLMGSIVGFGMYFVYISFRQYRKRRGEYR